MKKIFTTNKEKAICDIWKIVAEQHTIDVLVENSKVICLEYFPNADEMLLNTYADFCYFAQHYYYCLKELNPETNRYARLNPNG